MDKFQALADAVGQHQDLIKSTKLRYTGCIAQLVNAPADAALLAELTQLSGTLASTAAGLYALEQALEQAREADATREAEQRNAAGRKSAVQVQIKVSARRASYDALQAASDAFIAILKAHVNNSEALRAEASSGFAAGQRVECAVTRICATSMTAPGIFACYAERSN